LGESRGSVGLVASKSKGFRGICGEEPGDEKLRFVCLHDLSLFGEQV